MAESLVVGRNVDDWAPASEWYAEDEMKLSSWTRCTSLRVSLLAPPLQSRRRPVCTYTRKANISVGLANSYPELHNALKGYRGTDLTPMYEGCNGPKMFDRLTLRDGLVCAEICYPPRKISGAELAEHARLPDLKTQKTGYKWSVWVTSPNFRGEELVYDVTRRSGQCHMSGCVFVGMLTHALLVTFRYGSRNEQQRVRPWLGKVVKDEDTQDWLRDMRAGWVIGQLIARKRKAEKMGNAQKG